MTPYNEQEVVGFIGDATSAYQQAHRSPDPNALVWVARMQFDAEGMGYAASRAKHLDELRVALGLKPAPPVPAGPPVDIRTKDVAEIQVRVDYWVAQATPGWSADRRAPYVKFWMDAIILNPEPGHDTGWTADDYWSNWIMRGDYV